MTNDREVYHSPLTMMAQHWISSPLWLAFEREPAADSVDIGLECEFESGLQTPWWPRQQAASTIGDVRTIEQVLRSHK